MDATTEHCWRAVWANYTGPVRVVLDDTSIGHGDMTDADSINLCCVVLLDDGRTVHPHPRHVYPAAPNGWGRITA